MRHPFRWLLDRRRKQPELSRIRKAAEKLDISRLTGIEGDIYSQFTLNDVMPETSPSKLFRYYTSSGIDYALEELGVYPIIRKLGFNDLKAEVIGDDWGQDLKIYGKSSGVDHLVVEGRFKRVFWEVPPGNILYEECRGQQFSTVSIEWFLLQNPLAEFVEGRPRLPGQKYPGLGIRDEINEVFFAVARRLNLDAYTAYAKLFHNALIYSPVFFCVNPEKQAEITAIKNVAGDTSLQDVTLAIEGGFLFRDGIIDAYEWKGSLMIRPLSKNLLSAYERSGYRDMVEKLTKNISFNFDWSEYEKNKMELMKTVFEDHPSSPTLY